MAEIKKLQVDGADIYPVTHESAVYDNEGKSIESKYLSSVAYTEGDDIKIADESGNIIDTSELEAQIEEVDTKVGELSNLQTTDKDNIVDAINEVFQCGNNVKQGLVDALIAQGVQASTSETFESLIGKINSIEGESSSPYNIITATELPATGVENQLCVLTDTSSTSYYFNASSNTTPSDAITFHCISGREANYMVTLNGVTSLYNISHCSQNNEVKPVWIYTNGEWINISLASEVIMEDGYLDTSKNNFYNATFDSDNYWTYYEGVGLYTSAINNGYYATVSTSETVNFSGYNQVIIKARVDSDSTYGIALVYLESPTNQLHSTETYATITEYQQLSMTATDYVFDISTWDGEGYLGFVRYNADTAKVWITDISLSLASLGGSEGSGDDSGGAEELVNAYTLFNSSTDILELDSSSWSCTDTTAADVLACDTSDGIFSIGFNGSFYFDGDVDGVRAYKDTTSANNSRRSRVSESRCE